MQLQRRALMGSRKRAATKMMAPAWATFIPFPARREARWELPIPLADVHARRLGSFGLRSRYGAKVLKFRERMLAE